MPRPTMFVGSSAEALAVAQAIQSNLDHEVEVTVWSEADFRLTQSTLSSLVKMRSDYQCATFVLVGDDLLVKRGRKGVSPRDNVIFELGLFIGALGPERVFIVSRRGEQLQLPTDLLGITTATYDHSRTDGNLQAAVSSACTKIRQELRRAGLLSAARPPRTVAGKDTPRTLAAWLDSLPEPALATLRLYSDVDTELSLPADSTRTHLRAAIGVATKPVEAILMDDLRFSLRRREDQ